ADLIFAIGASLTASQFSVPLPPGKRTIHAVIDERDFNKDYPATIPLQGDAQLVLKQLLEVLSSQTSVAISPPDRQMVVAEISEQKKKTLAQWSHLLLSDEIPITPYRVI